MTHPPASRLRKADLPLLHQVHLHPLKLQCVGQDTYALQLKGL